MRITYDRDANAAYLRFTDIELEPGRTTIPAELPAGIDGWVVLDWKDDRLVGIEILDADARLHPDLLEQAEDITDSHHSRGRHPRVRTGDAAEPSDEAVS